MLHSSSNHSKVPYCPSRNFTFLIMAEKVFASLLDLIFIPANPVFQSSWTPLPQAPAFLLFPSPCLWMCSSVLHIPFPLCSAGRSLLLLQSLPKRASVSLWWPAFSSGWLGTLIPSPLPILKTVIIESPVRLPQQAPWKWALGPQHLGQVPHIRQEGRSLHRASYPREFIWSSNWHIQQESPLPSVALHNVFLQL